MSTVQPFSKRAVVANAGYPLIRTLAKSLAQAGLLAAYVEAWAASRDDPRSVTHRLSRLPLPGQNTLCRRLLDLPSGTPITSAAVVEEVIRVGLRLSGSRFPIETAQLQYRLLTRRDRQISLAAAKSVSDDSHAIASYGAALELFETLSVMTMSGKALLDYPIAHNRFKNDLMKEEAGFDPEFATLGNKVFIPEAQLERMDRECALADSILVATDYSARTFIQQGIDESKLAVIPYGLKASSTGESRSRPRSVSGPLRVLFVGNISQLKGLRYLLEATSSFSKRNLTIDLVGAATGPLDPILRYGDNVKYHGYLTGGALQHQFSRADVLVLPSLVEGFGMAALEAMAQGVPVIATNTGPSQFLRNHVDGILVPIRDARAIRDAFQQIIDQPEKYLAMQRNCRVRALEFTESRYTTSVMSLLH